MEINKLDLSLQQFTNKKQQKLIVLVDGVFFQIYKTGIARVWHNLLKEWAKTDFGKYIVFLDRDNTAPKVDGIRYRNIPRFNFNDLEVDCNMLQQVCDEESADVFISSYYTIPITTNSVFIAYDMLPEFFGVDLNDPEWQLKHNGIRHASAYIAISENTAKDLARFFQGILKESITIAHCGVQKTFSPSTDKEMSIFKFKYGITKPFFLVVGAGYGDSYKNTDLFLKAYSYLASRQGFDIIITGHAKIMSTEYRSYTNGGIVHFLQLSDQELAIAYSCALALIYPSKYEGFGMPILEAMACGCPVITCPNASIPEVAGEAVLYVNSDDTDGMTNALCDIQKPSIRRSLIDKGLSQATKFSWTKMADIISNTLIDTSLLYLNLSENNFIILPNWSLSRDLLIPEIVKVIRSVSNNLRNQRTTLLIEGNGLNSDHFEVFLSDIALNLLIQEDLEIPEGLNISLVGNLDNIQWKYLLTRIQASIPIKHKDRKVLDSSIFTNIPIYDLSLRPLSN